MAISAKTTLLGVVIAALALVPAAQAAEIREQPASVEKPGIVEIEWTAESADSPTVVVERRHGLDWVPAETGGIRVDEVAEGVWAARWQSSYDSPLGAYRIRVEGADYALTSDPFTVRACVCVIPNELRSKWREGAFRLRVTAEYWPASADSFLTLPTWVTTGRPVVRVFRNGNRIGSVLLRYRAGKFRGTWRGPRGSRDAVVFRLVSLNDGFGNR